MHGAVDTIEVQTSLWSSPVWKPVYSFPCDVDSDDLPDPAPEAASHPEPASEPSSPDASCRTRPPLSIKDHQLPTGICLLVTTTRSSSVSSPCTVQASICRTTEAYLSPSAPSTPPQPRISLRAATPLSCVRPLALPTTPGEAARPAASSTTYVKRPRSPLSPSSSIKKPASPASPDAHAPTPTLPEAASPASPACSTPPLSHPAPSPLSASSSPMPHQPARCDASSCTQQATAAPAADPPGPLHYLDTTSRILLCVPDALLKEVVKVPLATALDKFLYSVVPSSADVLPVYSLGAGAFGQVKLVYVETPHPRQELRMCAVKSVLPAPAYQASDFWREVEVMELCRDCPHVLHLFSAAADSSSYHMLMEVAGNGCLRDLLWAASMYSEEGLPVHGVTEEAARYLVAGLLLALQHLHSLHIAHLDIKPENVLLDATNRSKLADFGVALRLKGCPTPTDVVGTPGYQPPEMLSGAGYGVAADMWACGMLAYQLVAGDLPEDWQVDLLLEKGIFRPPAGLSQDLEHLLSGLLATDPHVRLTAAQAMCHPWFDGFSWAAFLDGSMPAPAIPIYHQMPNQRPDAGAARRG